MLHAVTDVHVTGYGAPLTSIVFTPTGAVPLIVMKLRFVLKSLPLLLVIPKFAATKDKSKLASVRSDLRNIMTAQEAYYIDYSTYTGALSTLVFQPSQGIA